MQECDVMCGYCIRCVYVMGVQACCRLGYICVSWVGVVMCRVVALFTGGRLFFVQGVGSFFAGVLLVYRREAACLRGELLVYRG